MWAARKAVARRQEVPLCWRRALPVVAATAVALTVRGFLQAVWQPEGHQHEPRCSCDRWAVSRALSQTDRKTTLPDRVTDSAPALWIRQILTTPSPVEPVEEGLPIRLLAPSLEPSLHLGCVVASHAQWRRFGSRQHQFWCARHLSSNPQPSRQLAQSACSTLYPLFLQAAGGLQTTPRAMGATASMRQSLLLSSTNRSNGMPAAP